LHNLSLVGLSLLHHRHQARQMSIRFDSGTFKLSSCFTILLIITFSSSTYPFLIIRALYCPFLSSILFKSTFPHHLIRLPSASHTAPPATLLHRDSQYLASCTPNNNYYLIIPLGWNDNADPVYYKPRDGFCCAIPL
jgi:hypothetical protein